MRYGLLAAAGSTTTSSTTTAATIGWRRGLPGRARRGFGLHAASR